MQDRIEPFVVALTVIDADELDALRDKAEICEDVAERKGKEARDSEWLANAHKDEWFRLAVRSDEFREAAYEAVEVLEDQVTQFRDFFFMKKPDSSYYVEFGSEFVRHAYEAVEVLEDMYEQRDAETARWFDKWKYEYEAHDRDKRALRDAEATIAELHRKLDRMATRNVELATQKQGRTIAAIREQLKKGRAVYFMPDGYGLTIRIRTLTAPKGFETFRLLSDMLFDSANGPADAIMASEISNDGLKLDRKLGLA